MLRVICLAVLVLARTVESDKEWEFGYETRFQVVIDIIHGKISPQEKTKPIPIQVPKCLDIKYVSVVVQNNISVPDVTYNKANETVKISYKPLQISRSEYEVTAKGKRSLKCSQEEMLNLWGGGGGCFVEINHKTGRQKGGCAEGYGENGGGGDYNGWRGGGWRKNARRRSKRHYDKDCIYICQKVYEDSKKKKKKKKYYSSSYVYSSSYYYSSSYSSSSE